MATDERDPPEDLHEALGVEHPSELFEQTDGFPSPSSIDLPVDADRALYESFRERAPKALRHLGYFRWSLLQDAKHAYNEGKPQAAQTFIRCAEDIERDMEFWRQITRLVLAYLAKDIQEKSGE